MRDAIVIAAIASAFFVITFMVASTAWHQHKVAQIMTGPVTAFYIYSQGRWVKFVPSKDQK